MDAELEGVPATDELRERLRVVLAENGVDEAPSTLHSWRCEYPERYGKCDCIAELVTDLAAVVAEARTEALNEVAEILSKPGVVWHGDDGVTVRTDPTWREPVVPLVEWIRQRAVGVGNQKVGVTVDDLALDEMDGNQNAEPRWSANRLEEVLRDGLPDQNAEPDWEWGYGHESESGLVPVLGFEGRYSEGRSREIAEKQMNDDLRWRYPLALMKRRKAGPWLPVDQKGTEQ